MTVKLLTENSLEFLSLKEAAQARLSLHLSKCHIVGNHMSRLSLYPFAYCLLQNRDIIREEASDVKLSFSVPSWSAVR